MTNTAKHTAEVTTFSNGAPAKARRSKCSCGYLGPRIAYFPHDKAGLKKATAKAQADADRHVAEHAAH